MDHVVASAFVLTLLASGLQLAMPVLLAALGEIFAERAGVLNIGIEGTCLLGALAGFLTMLHTGHPWLALFAGAAVGVLANAFLAWMYIEVRASQVVVGIIFNLLAFAAASFVYRLAMEGFSGVAQVPMFEPLRLPLLADLPLIGPLLFRQIAPFYGVLLLVVVAHRVLFHSSFGLSVRAVGENPRAAEAAGLNVARLRHAAVLIGGAAAGLSGAYLVLGRIGLFRDSIVSGQGFIALAVVIFGRWKPLGAALAALSFGCADALQISLQMFHVAIPTQLFLALPYLLTALAISGLFGKARQPAALLTPYARE
jgi:general nucleoside transport system permease protein